MTSFSVFCAESQLSFGRGRIVVSFVFLEFVQISADVILCLGQVLFEIIAAFRSFRSRDLSVVAENELAHPDDEPVHVGGSLVTEHYQIKSGAAAHRPEIDDIVFRSAVAQYGRAEMCNTMEDLRNLLKQCDFKTNTEDDIQISPELLQETISKTKHLKTVTRSDIQRLLRIEYSKAAKLYELITNSKIN